MDQQTQGAVNIPTGPEAEDVASFDSALVVQVDQLQTRGLLFDTVDNAARLVSSVSLPSTGGRPFLDLSVGINQLLRELEHESGRHLLAPSGVITPQDHSGDGVDRVYVTGQPVEPSRAALLSIGGGDVATEIAAAVRRTQTALSDAHDYFGDGSVAFTPSNIEQWLRLSMPRTVILVAGAGSTDDWRMAVQAVATASAEMGVVQGIIVADEERQQIAAAYLEALIDLSGIDPSHHDIGSITSALEGELREHSMTDVESDPGLAALSEGAYTDRLQAGKAVVSYLSRQVDGGVAAISIDEGSILQLGIADGTASVGEVDIDLNRHARGLLGFSAESVSRWLPLQVGADEFRHWALNRTLHPQIQPDGDVDQRIAAGAAREIVSLMFHHAGSAPNLDVRLIVLRSDTFANDPVMAALVMLDGVQPNPATGVVQLAFDHDSLLDAIGAIAMEDPLFARDLAQNDFLTPLATCIVCVGDGEDGSPAVRGEVVQGDDREAFTVPYGYVHRIEINDQAQGSLRLTPEPGFSIGSAGPGESFDLELADLGSSSIGIIIDARGRPLRLPEDTETRIGRIKTWTSDLGGEID